MLYIFNKFWQMLKCKKNTLVVIIYITEYMFKAIIKYSIIEYSMVFFSNSISIISEEFQNKLDEKPVSEMNVLPADELTYHTIWMVSLMYNLPQAEKFPSKDRTNRNSLSTKRQENEAKDSAE